MKKKIVSKFIFEGFGFPVILHNIILNNHNGEEYPEINYNDLEFKTVQSLLITNKAITGHQLKFLRKFIKKSLRELGHELKVSHAQIKIIEEKNDHVSGLNSDQERRFKNIVLNHFLFEQQKILSDKILSQSLIQDSSEGPFDPYEFDKKTS